MFGGTAFHAALDGAAQIVVVQDSGVEIAGDDAAGTQYVGHVKQADSGSHAVVPKTDAVQYAVDNTELSMNGELELWSLKVNVDDNGHVDELVGAAVLKL